MYNTLPLIHDGKVIHIYYKKSAPCEISADFRFRRERFTEPKYHNFQERKYVFQPGAGSNKFSVWGMRMGVEICADRNTAILKNELATGEDLDFQFLISARQSVRQGSVAVSNGGVLIHTDGSIGPANQSVNIANVHAFTNLKTINAAVEREPLDGTTRIRQFQHG